MLILLLVSLAYCVYDVNYQYDPAATIAQFAESYSYSDTGPLMTNPTKPYMNASAYGCNRTTSCAGYSSWLPSGHHGATRLTMSNLNIQATFPQPFALSMFYIEDSSISPAYDIVLIMEMVKADGTPGQWILLFLTLKNIPVTPLNTIDCSPYINFSYLNPGHYMKQNAMTSISYNGSIDIMPCIRHAVQDSFIQSTDKINKIKFEMRYYFGDMCLRIDDLKSVSDIIPIFVETQQGYLHGLRQFQIDVYGINPLLTDYFYLKKPVSALAPLSTLLIDYSQTANKLNGVARYIIGNYGTNPTEQIIPTALVPLVSEAIAIEITTPIIHTVLQAGQTALCAIIKIRSDWDNVNLWLTNVARQEPNYEIRLCSQYSLTTPLTRLIDVSVGGREYEQYDGSDSLNGNNWPFKLFKPKDALNLFTSLNVMPFVHYVNSKGLLGAGDVVAGLEVGLWVMRGSGRLQPGGLVFTATVVATPQQLIEIMAPPPPTPSSFPTQSEIMKILQSPQTGNSFQAIILTPNLCLLSNFLTFVRFVTDLSFFQYHQKSYDSSFWNFSRVSWNIENGTFIPEEISNAFAKIGLSYSQKIVAPKANDLPQSYNQLQDEYHFLKSTELYWILTLPLNTIVFCLIFVLRKLINNQKLNQFLSKYKYFSFLVISLVSQNVLFFSFRGFTQLFCIGYKDPFSVINMSISYIMLFISFVYSVSSPWVFAYLNNHDTLIVMYDEYRVTRRAFLCQTLYLTLRFLSGAVHSLFYYSPIFQISILCAIQIVNLCIWVSMKGLFTIKSRYAVRCCQSCLRIVMHSLLVMEVTYKVTDELSFAIANLNECILMSVFILSVIDVVLGMSISGSVHLRQKNKNILKKIKMRRRIITQRLERARTEHRTAEGTKHSINVKKTKKDWLKIKY